MTQHDYFPELESLCVEFEEQWTTPSPDGVAQFISSKCPPELAVTTVIAEVLGIEFDLIAFHGELPRASLYHPHFPGHEAVIDACVGAWILRALDARLSVGEITTVESLAQQVDFASQDTHALLDLFEEEQRMRRSYGIPTREKEYAAHFSELWPTLRKRLIAANLFEDDYGVVATPLKPTVHLQVLTGPHEGEQFSFTEHDSFVVGRGSRCRMRMADDPYFSRYHLRIEINPPECHLIDLESRNGTYVNGQQVPEAALRHGDQVSAGQTAILVRVQGAHGRSVLPSVDPTQTWSHHPTGFSSAADSGSVSVDRPDIGSGDNEAHVSFESELEPPLPSVKKVAVDFDRLSTGAVIPGYSIEEPIDTHPVRVVYRGVKDQSGEAVAIKLFQFERGVDNSAMKVLNDTEAPYRRLEHRRIGKVLEIGRLRSQLFIVSQFIPSISREIAWGSKNRKDQVRLACGVICFGLEALETAHRSGLIHGNLNPSNVLVTKTDNRLGGRLVDFGVALQMQRAGLGSIVRSNQDDASFSYLAPERLLELKNATPEGDIYSMGATLYQFLSGAPPVESSGVAASMASILNQGVVSLSDRVPDLPKAVVDIVHKAMHPSPNKRFVSAAEFYGALFPLTRK